MDNRITDCNAIINYNQHNYCIDKEMLVNKMCEVYRENGWDYLSKRFNDTCHAFCIGLFTLRREDLEDYLIQRLRNGCGAEDLQEMLINTDVCRQYYIIEKDTNVVSWSRYDVEDFIPTMVEHMMAYYEYSEREQAIQIIADVLNW